MLAAVLVEPLAGATMVEDHVVTRRGVCKGIAEKRRIPERMDRAVRHFERRLLGPFGTGADSTGGCTLQRPSTHAGRELMMETEQVRHTFWLTVWWVLLPRSRSTDLAG